jgi:transcription antitermination factor NusG
MRESDYRFSWYALQVRPNSEDVVSSVLSYKGYETYVPKYRAELYKGGQKRSKERRLFPGYVFCRFSPAQSGMVNLGAGVVTTFGVLRIVGTGDAPAAIPDSEIEAIERILSSYLTSGPSTYLHVGQKINIASGPLRGISGLLISVDNMDSLLVSVEVLHRSLAVRIQRDWISPTSVLHGLRDLCEAAC